MLKKWQLIGIIILFVLILADFWHDAFAPKAIFIKNIHDRSFNDTINNIYTEKVARGVVTSLRGCDTVIIINGVNDSLHIWFSSYGDLGLENWTDSHISKLIKKANSDSFYLERDSKKTGFRLTNP
jgi:hypothetical protein